MKKFLRQARSTILPLLLGVFLFMPAVGVHAAGDGDGVVVAVIGSGVDYNHPNLKDNIWVNSKEDRNCNGKLDGVDRCPHTGNYQNDNLCPQRSGYDPSIDGDFDCCDNDGNGAIDDVVGINFVSSPYNGVPMDTNGRGTHLAGIVASTGKNNASVVGVAKKAKIMPIKIYENPGEAVTSDVLTSRLDKALNYARLNGADIILLDYYCPGFMTGTAAACSSSLATINSDLDLINNQSGIVVVPAGDNGQDISVYFPQNAVSFVTGSGLLAASVSGVDSTNNLLGTSNTGLSLDEAALGASVTSTAPGGLYSVKSGTAQAAAYAAGTAAVLKSQYPSLTGIDIRHLLQDSTDDVSTVGRDASSGYGKVNLTKALARSWAGPAKIVTPANRSFLAHKPSGNTIAIQGVATDRIGEANTFGSYKLYVGEVLNDVGDSVGPETEIPETNGGTSNVATQGTLATWNYDSLAVGKIYRLRLEVTTKNTTPTNPPGLPSNAYKYEDSIVLRLENDSDGNGIVDIVQNCVAGGTADTADKDCDGIKNVADNCIDIANGPYQASNQVDTDHDGYGDVCDATNGPSGIGVMAQSVDPVLSCNPQFIPSIVCGDGILEGHEQCDAGQNGGQTCQSLGFTSGTLNCYGPTTPQACQFDTRQCVSGCTTNADCVPFDDGLYCNGTSVCVNNTCQQSGNPCLSGQFCNEATDQCPLLEGCYEQNQKIITPAAATLVYGDTLFVGNGGYDGTATDQGAVQVYQRTNGTWVASTPPVLVAPDPTAGAALGGRIAIDGNILAVTGGGSIYVFEKQANGSWSTGTKLTVPAGASEFGSDVDVSGTSIIVGANQAAYLYTRGATLGSWTLTKTFTNPSTATNTTNAQGQFVPGATLDQFGKVVDVEGNYVAISAVNYSTTAALYMGAVYIYEKDPASGVWGTPKAYMGPMQWSYLGSALDMKGSSIAVGAYYDGLRGSVYVYDRVSAGNWGTPKKIQPTDAYMFGYAVDLEDKMLVVGDPRQNNGLGAAYIYLKDATNNWKLLKKVAPTDLTGLAYYGLNLSVSNSTVAVGAYYKGAVYMYEACPGQCPTGPTGNAQCNDNLYCNGVETCVNNYCVAGTPPVVTSDNIACTTDYCDEYTHAILHSPNNYYCRQLDGFNVCNGNETCSPATGDPVTGCKAGTPLNCNDGLYCNGTETCNTTTGCVVGTNPCTTGQVCNETTDQCAQCISDSNCPVGQHCNAGSCVQCVADSNCNNNNACDGVETCNLTTHACVAGTPINCSDGQYCNGTESCNSVTGACQAGTNPCTTGQVCDESVDQCGQCLTDSNCPSGQHCKTSTHSCVACVSNSNCVDSNLCNGAETCNLTTNTCVAGTPVVCGDGLYCNGSETCNPATGACQAGTSPCTTGQVCDEAVDQCGQCLTDSNCPSGQHCKTSTHSCVACVSNSNCADTNLCNGNETCNLTTNTCVAGTPVVCGDGLYCNGTETCNPATGACQAGTPPCNPATQTCNEATDQCVASGGCTTNADCANDGLFCNGTSVCVNNTCQQSGNPCPSGQFCQESTDKCLPLEGCYQQTQKLISPTPTTTQQFGRDTLVIGDTLFVGNMGTVHVYDRLADGTWGNHSVLTAPEALDGMKIARSNNILTVTGGGGIYVFEKSGSSWGTPTKLTAPVGSNGFGADVDISNNILVVGATQAAYVYERVALGNWGTPTKIINPSTVATYTNSSGQTVPGAAYDLFGEVVDVDGNYLAISARNHSEPNALYTGAVYIYERVAAGNWGTPTTLLHYPSPTQWSYLGNAMDIKGNSIAIAAFYDGFIGAVYVYDRVSAGNWGIPKKIQASDGYMFGQQVDLEDKVLVVGDQRQNNGAGGSYIYLKDATNNWKLLKKITASDPETNALYGTNLSVSNSTVAVGAYLKDESGNGAAGAVYMYEACPGQCQTNADCDDKLYCNGAETCVNNYCVAGTPPNVNDNIACTSDWCRESDHTIQHTPINAWCSDGLYCDGTETCNATLGCQAGTAPCNPTTQSCNESTDMCEDVVSIFIEAENADNAAYLAPVAIRQSIAATNGKFIISPQSTRMVNGISGTICSGTDCPDDDAQCEINDFSGTGSCPTVAEYTFNLPYASTYDMYVRMFTGNAGRDSFYYKIDDGPTYFMQDPANCVHYNEATGLVDPAGNRCGWPAANKHYDYLKMTQGGTAFTPINFNLSAGAHKLKIATRRSGTRIDQFLITNSKAPKPYDINTVANNGICEGSENWTNSSDCGPGPTDNTIPTMPANFPVPTLTSSASNYTQYQLTWDAPSMDNGAEVPTYFVSMGGENGLGAIPEHWVWQYMVSQSSTLGKSYTLKVPCQVMGASGMEPLVPNSVSALPPQDGFVCVRGIDAAGNESENRCNAWAIPTCGAGADVTLFSKISAAADDAEEKVTDGTMTVTDATLDVGEYLGSFGTTSDDYKNLVGLKFSVAGIPQGARIVEAHIQFHAMSYSDLPTSVNIFGELNPSAPSFTSSNFNISSRTRTTVPGISWSPTSFIAHGDMLAAERTPDISSVVQQIVNLSTWSASGSQLAIMLENTTTSGTRSAKSSEVSPEYNPVLYIKYQDTTNATPVCGNGKVEGTEQCDGGNLNASTCSEFGYDTGTLTCNSNCTFNTSACSNYSASCLNETLMLSYSLDRSNAEILGTNSVSNRSNTYIYIFYSICADHHVYSVSFYLDDPTMANPPKTVEQVAPLDFVGTNNDGSAKPFDASQLTTGTHNITLRVVHTDGTTSTVSKNFTVTH